MTQRIQTKRWTDTNKTNSLERTKQEEKQEEGSLGGRGGGAKTLGCQRTDDVVLTGCCYRNQPLARFPLLPIGSRPKAVPGSHVPRTSSF